MTLWIAAFESAPSGTPIPVTGGTAAFDDGGNFSAGGSFVSDSTVPAAVAGGTYCAKITTGSSGDWMFRGWFLTGTAVYHRAYYYLTAYPSVSVSLWDNYASDYAGNPVSRLRIDSSGALGLSVGINAPTVASMAIPLNTLVRVETSFDHTAGTMSVDAYLGHSTSAISGASVSLSGLTFPGVALRETIGGVVGYVSSFTLRTDAWAVSDTARVGPLVTGSTVTGVTATVVAQADGGSVSTTLGGPVNIAGVTATVVVQGGVRPEPPAPAAVDASWPPDPYREAIRSGGIKLAYKVAADVGGVPVAGATDLRPTGGTSTDTTKPGVRRLLNLELAPEPGLFDLLAPVGTTLTVTAQVTYTDRTTLDIPMGVFDVDSEKLSEGGGGLSLTAPDKWARIQRARFVVPQSSTPGMLVVDQIASLIRGALGQGEVVAVATASLAKVGALTWEKDRDKAILDLAAGIGCWVFFDRLGVATIADIPTVGASADWLVDASPSGVLTELDRERSRTVTRNVVVVESSASDGAAFPTQIVWDDDPDSPTYAGPDPINHPELAGPFGVSVEYFDTPLPLDAGSARAAGLTMLYRVTGLASQISASQVPNPAMDAFAVIDVLPPKERGDISRVLERHIADTVTHGLTVDGPLHIEGRSTRTEELVGGS